MFTKEELYEQLEPLVKQLMDEPEGAAFRAPVDPIKENIPDYFDVVKKPMDLGMYSCGQQSLKHSFFKLFPSLS